MKKERLENGLQKIQSASTQVDDLKEKLKAQEVEVNLKNEEASKLIQIVGTEKEKVDKEKAVADEEERKVSKIQEDVSAKKEDCERDLSKAMPALEAAKAALDTLNKVLTRFRILFSLETICIWIKSLNNRAIGRFYWPGPSSFAVP